MKKQLKQILEFRDNRNWKQFHSPKNLAISISLEAAEILEIFQWSKNNKLPKESKDQLEAEIADVFAYLLLLAHETGVDIETAFNKKIKENELKYPIEKSKGKSTKYNKLK